MTLDTIRELAEGELEDGEIDEAKSTVRRYLRAYDNRVGLDEVPGSGDLKSNFSPTYRENMAEAFGLYALSRDDGFTEAINSMFEEGVEKDLDGYLDSTD